MRLSFCAWSALLAALAWAALAAGEMRGPLRVHPENPRYFTDDSGEAILLTGSHTWSNLLDMGPSDPPPPFDFNAYLAWLKGYGHNFTRGWTWEPARWDTTGMTPAWRNANHTIAPQPWLRTGPGAALDGKPQFDLERVNPAYLERLSTRVRQARDQGIYISIMLFEGFAVQFQPETWANHPFNLANNVNGIDGDVNGDGKGLEVHQLGRQRVTEIQEAFVRAVLKTLNGFDNVLYEISNETHPDSTDWQYHMIAFIKNCEKEMPKQHPVGMTFQYAGGQNETLFNSPADWVSPNSDGGYRDDPSDAAGRKVVLSDTDHLWGIGGDAAWVWKTVTRGLNPLFMDPYEGRVLAKEVPEFEEPRRAMGRALEYCRRMNLVRATPQNGLASTGYCLAEQGAAYLVFAPEGGAFEVDLTAAEGPFTVEWCRPGSGDISLAESLPGGVKQTFTPPFDGPAVLFLHTVDAP